MKQDVIEVEVLHDGTIKIITNPISQANHTNAEGLVTALTRAAGGETSRQKRGATHSHGHHHHHSHADAGHSH